MSWKQSYSCKIVSSILDEFNIEYNLEHWNNCCNQGMSLTTAAVLLPNKTLLTIATHPEVAMWSFCETQGYIPKSFTQDQNGAENILRHQTPDDLKAFMLDTLQEIYTLQPEVVAE